MSRPVEKPGAIGAPGAYQPRLRILRWLEDRLPIGGLIPAQFVAQFLAHPTPRNLNYWWSFGGILSFMLGVHDYGVFYVGLGDRFDDDRRRVRATEQRAVLWEVNMAISFKQDIRPIFSDVDMRCMGKLDVRLD